MKRGYSHILLYLLMLTFVPARAYDLVVSMVNEETGKKISDIEPMATYPDLKFIASPVKNEADTTYMFKNLPEEKIMICYSVNGNTISKTIDTPLSTLTIVVPAYIRQKSTMLDEVVVESDRKYVSAEKKVYRPTAQEKNLASDGSQLINIMGIVELRVSPSGGKISTITGEPVNIYIDFLPADDVTVANIRTADVKRIEIYDFPQDPRFGGAKHVVNFIMVKYEYGGYTKASARQWFILNEGSYSAYSKLAYKKMTYEAAFRGAYTNSTHMGVQQHIVYDFPDEDVTYDSEYGGATKKSHTINASLKGTYQTDKSVISNRLTINYGRMPDFIKNISDKYSSPLYNFGDVYSNESTKKRVLSWDGNYMFFLPHEFSLTLNPKFSYGKHNSNYLYSTGDFSVTNDVSDDAYMGRLGVSVNKNWSKLFLGVGLSGSYEQHDLDYQGSLPAIVNSKYYELEPNIKGRIQFGKFMLSAAVYANLTRSDISGVKNDECNPQGQIYLYYGINSKNTLTVVGQMARMTANKSYTGSNIQLVNQIEAIEGNPYIKASLLKNLTLNYNLKLSQNLDLAAYVDYKRWSNAIAEEYSPQEIDAKQYMVKKYVNLGRRDIWDYGVVGSYSLFKKALMFWGSLSLCRVNQNSSMNYNNTNICYSWQVSYKWSKCYFAIDYKSKRKDISSDFVSDEPYYYSFTAGWGNGKFNIYGHLCNIFRSSWKEYTNTKDLKNYYSKYITYSPMYHRYIFITVSYSFSYGKKVQHEYGEGDILEGVGSGILK